MDVLGDVELIGGYWLDDHNSIQVLLHLLLGHFG